MKLVKYRFMLDYEEEERWINEMSKQGWHLKSFILGRFVFEKGEPNAYTYRNEYLIDMKKLEKEEYITLLEDSGAEVVHESLGWLYVRKLSSEGVFELYSDSESKIVYYNKMLRIFTLLCGINVFFMFLNIFILSNSDPFGGVNGTVGFINGIVALIMLVPIGHIRKSKKKVEEEKHLYE